MKKAQGGKPEVDEVSFKPAEGGVISETRSKYKRGGQGGGPDYDYEHTTAIHSTIEHAQAHLAKTMGGHYGKESEPEKGEGKEE